MYTASPLVCLSIFIALLPYFPIEFNPNQAENGAHC